MERFSTCSKGFAAAAANRAGGRTMKPRGLLFSGVTPIVLAYPPRTSLGYLAFWCPWCQTVHRHGAAGGDGHRAAHCDPGSPLLECGYDLLFSGIVVSEKFLPRISAIELATLSNLLRSVGVRVEMRQAKCPTTPANRNRLPTSDCWRLRFCSRGIILSPAAESSFRSAADLARCGSARCRTRSIAARFGDGTDSLARARRSCPSRGVAIGEYRSCPLGRERAGHDRRQAVGHLFAAAGRAASERSG